MFALKFLNENSQAITALSVLAAALGWLFRVLHKSHHEELAAIKRLERGLVLNATALRDNIKLMNQWENSLRECRAFKAHFETILVDNEDTYHLSDLDLINKIFKINYRLKRFNDDLSNMYNHHWEVIHQLEKVVPERRDAESKLHCEKVLAILGSIKIGAMEIQDEIPPIEAHLRVLARVRRHSLIGYLELLNTVIIPRVTDKALAAETRIVNCEIEFKKVVSENRRIKSGEDMAGTS